LEGVFCKLAKALQEIKQLFLFLNEDDDDDDDDDEWRRLLMTQLWKITWLIIS